MPKNIPWDIYVDECKVRGDYCLGFLEVPNTASFMHKLFRCRERIGERGVVTSKEVHWHEISRYTATLAKVWIDLFFQHRGVRFTVAPWSRNNSKEIEILTFVRSFCERRGLTPPHNVVVILDYDNEHARSRIQNSIRQTARISRCYHLDSLKNDCLQCCDLLLGAARTLRNDPTVRSDYHALATSFPGSLSNSQIKRFLAGHLGMLIDGDSSKIYDVRDGDESLGAE